MSFLMKLHVWYLEGVASSSAVDHVMGGTNEINNWFGTLLHSRIISSFIMVYLFYWIGRPRLNSRIIEQLRFILFVIAYDLFFKFHGVLLCFVVVISAKVFPCCRKKIGPGLCAHVSGCSRGSLRPMISFAADQKACACEQWTNAWKRSSSIPLHNSHR